MSAFLLDDIPFKTVYLHGLVRDENRRKMSKSVGNVIDPLDMTKKYGADALRMALIFNTAPGTDSAISEAKIKGMKNFANKLWNITRFVLDNTQDADMGVRYSKNDTNIRNYFDQIILRETTKNLNMFRLDLAAEVLYQYIWHKFADMIVEYSKTIFRGESPEEAGPEYIASRKKLLRSILMDSLKLLHPFMPFITEKIWQEMNRGQKILMVEEWPS